MYFLQWHLKQKAKGSLLHPSQSLIDPTLRRRMPFPVDPRLVPQVRGPNVMQISSRQEPCTVALLSLQ